MVQPIDWQKEPVRQRKACVNNYNHENECEQSLEESADEVVCVVFSLKCHRVDSGPLPNPVRTPNKGRAQVR